MASKSHRLKKRKKRKKAQAKTFDRGVPVTSSNITDLPRPLRLVVEAGEALSRCLEEADFDPLLAAEDAEQEARGRCQNISRITAPFDAFDVLEAVRLSQAPMNPETYKETEHEGSPAVIELVAAVLRRRGERAGTLPETDGKRERPDSVIDEVLREAQAALRALSTAAMLRIGSEQGPDGSLSLGAITREMFVRNLSYEHMLEDTLKDLFGGEPIATDVRRQIGCSVLDILAVFHAVRRSYEDAWNKRFESLQDFIEIAQREMKRESIDQESYSLSDETREQALSHWEDVWGNASDTANVAIDDLAQEAELSTEVTQRVLDLFSVDMTDGDPKDAAGDFLSGQSPFASRPFLRDARGSAVVVHHGLLTPAIRDRIESELKRGSSWEKYSTHRGDYLERSGIELVRPHLPDCEVFSGLDYFVPNDDASRPEETPNEYTKLVEGDGLILVDDVAIIIEAKSGSMSPSSRAGDPKRLRADLRKIVSSAAQQAGRLRDRIQQDWCLRLRDGSWLDLHEVREVHAIAISLEDLSGIATVTSELVRSGLLQGEELPWTVSLHDLRIVSELVARPSELLLYLRRRTDPDVTRRFHAVDELDFFLEYYSTGLYVEPDPERVAEELPQFGEPRVAARRRHKEQGLELLTSRTDQLDAWYFHELGMRATPAPKPAMSGDDRLFELLDALAEEREPGWLRIGTGLLDGDAATRRHAARYGADVVRMTKKDGIGHTVAAAGGTRAAESFVMVWRSVGKLESPEEALARLELYVWAKKHQLQVAWGAGLLFGSGSTKRPTATCYDNRRPGVDASLDALVEELRLRPASKMPRSLPPRSRR